MPVPDTARTGPNDALHRGLTDDLRLAHLLADDADSITMSRFRSLDLRVTSKPDLTPVSDADTAAEQAIRRTLSRARPRDAVQGEEMADTGWGPRRWVGRVAPHLATLGAQSCAGPSRCPESSAGAWPAR